jgi:hypothetical protein
VKVTTRIRRHVTRNGTVYQPEVQARTRNGLRCIEGNACATFEAAQAAANIMAANPAIIRDLRN